ncbi:MAG TPA: hypothetical protein VHC39_13250 [Rhizomicrobium sp.]|nr:hypothetical protein [Rhizomicrobium sp.]
MKLLFSWLRCGGDPGKVRYISRKFPPMPFVPARRKKGERRIALAQKRFRYRYFYVSESCLPGGGALATV